MLVKVVIVFIDVEECLRRRPCSLLWLSKWLDVHILIALQSSLSHRASVVARTFNHRVMMQFRGSVIRGEHQLVADRAARCRIELRERRVPPLVLLILLVLPISVHMDEHVLGEACRFAGLHFLPPDRATDFL